MYNLFGEMPNNFSLCQNVNERLVFCTRVGGQARPGYKV